ncbi:MAG: TonB-dependent receptor [Deltaproteobacteria bacterium]|nr:TonB-dependent receptor [Deltaproteobacteria bacterium]
MTCRSHVSREAPIKLCATFIVMLCAPHAVRAEDAPTSQPASQPVDIFGFVAEEYAAITLGSARTTTLREAPTSVWVIDEKTLRNTAAMSLVDSLRMIPGTLIRDYSLSNPDSGLRFWGGFPDVQTLVLVDGRTMSSDSIQLYDKTLLNLQDIERIEVVNGPSSTLYGPNAFNGVLSITRRRPPRQGDRATAQIDGGGVVGAELTPGAPYRLLPYTNAYTQYGHGWGSGGVQLSVGAQYTPTFGYHTDSGQILTLPGRRVSAMLDVVQDVNGWNLRLQGDFAYKTGILEIIDGGPNEQLDYAFTFTVEKQRSIRDDQLTLVTSFRSYTMHYSPRVALPAPSIIFASKTIETKGTYNLPTFFGNTLAIGVLLRGTLNDCDAYAPIGKTLLQFGIFAEDNYRPIKQLLITLGLRGDIHVSQGQGNPFQFLSFSPRASIVWLINQEHSLRLEYASASRTPSGTERAATFVGGDGQIFFVGNPNLRDEVVHSVGLSWLGKFRWLSVRLEPYIAYALNLVAPNATAYNDPTTEYLGQPLYQPEMGGRFKLPFYLGTIETPIPGAVARIDARPIENLHLFLQYTLVANSIMHVAGFGVDYTWRSFAVSTQVFFHDQAQADPTSPTDVPGRVIVNAKASYWLDAKKRWQVSASVLNLLDIRWFRFRTPGTFAYRGESNSGEAVGPRFWATVGFFYDRP